MPKQGVVSAIIDSAAADGAGPGAKASGATPTPVDAPEADLSRFTRWQWVEGRRTGVSSFEISGLHCAACAWVIEAAVQRCPGVLEVQVSAAALRATVRWDPDRTDVPSLLSAVQAAGYRAAPDSGEQGIRMRREEHRRVLWRFFVCAFLAMQVMMLATPSYVAGPGDLSPDLRQLLNWGSWVLSLPVVAFGGMPFVYGAWRSLRTRRIGMDVPVALGIAVAFVASSAATFDPSGLVGAEVYFDSLTMFLAFLWGARYVELRMRHRAARALESSAQALPQTALRVGTSAVAHAVPAADLAPGDRVRVPAGAAVPADGVLVTGPAELDEAMLSGESLPVLRQVGEGVLAGSLNAGPPFEMQVQRTGSDTRHETIVALMRESLAQRPSSARLADRWAGPFLWAVLATAAAASLAWLWVDPARAVGVAVAVLVVTCPCALALATPATVVAAVAGLARRGVLVRRLEVLEGLARLRHLFLDKTGTLTQEHLVLCRVDAGPAGDGPTMQALAASLAHWSSHPVSRALAQAQGAPAQGMGDRTDGSVPRQDLAPMGSEGPWLEVQEIAGKGLSARDRHGRLWRLGAPAWALGDDGRSDNPQARGNTTDAEDQATMVWAVLSRDGVECSRFGFAERLRPDARPAVASLQALGIDLTLLSGDTLPRSRAVAQQLGIAAVCHAASPEDKRAIVAQARSCLAGGAVVGMVGDGLNDAPVMAHADVALALGHGALAARRVADAVILSSRPGAVVDAVLTARAAMRIVRQNLAWSVGYNALCVPLAALGVLSPWLAGLGMALSSVVVILNAQRAAGTPPDAHLPNVS